MLCPLTCDMETEVKKLPNSKIEILFEIPWQEFFPYLDKAAQNLSQDLKFKGFRQGKAPNLSADERRQ